MLLDFEIPDTQHRLILWEKSITNEFVYDTDIDLEYLAEQYELSAASIINVLQYCMIKCLGRNDHLIRLRDIQAGLKMEKIKEGKSII